MRSFTSTLLALLALHSVPAWADYFWTAIASYQVSPVTTILTVHESTKTYTYSSNTRSIKNGATPTLSPLFTTSMGMSDANMLLYTVLYPSGAVREEDLIPDPTEVAQGFTKTANTMDTSTATYYVAPITYTAPPQCSSSFVFSTSETVYVPDQVTNQLAPTSRTTMAPTTMAAGGPHPFVVQEVIWYLTEGAVPTNSQPNGVNGYIQRCTIPPSSLYSGLDMSDADDSRVVCTMMTGCTSVRVWIIVIATLFPSLFVLGFFESYFWFTRLMKGKSCLRLATIFWLLCSGWMVFFLRRQQGRSLEDQKDLQAQWATIPFSRRLKLWLNWGFRHAYPTELLGKFSIETVGVTKQQSHGDAESNGEELPPPTYIATMADQKRG